MYYYIRQRNDKPVNKGITKAETLSLNSRKYLCLSVCGAIVPVWPSSRRTLSRKTRANKHFNTGCAAMAFNLPHLHVLNANWLIQEAIHLVLYQRMTIDLTVNRGSFREHTAPFFEWRFYFGVDPRLSPSGWRTRIGAYYRWLSDLMNWKTACLTVQWDRFDGRPCMFNSYL